jgi:hypothetical protein
MMALKSTILHFIQNCSDPERAKQSDTMIGLALATASGMCFSEQTAFFRPDNVLGPTAAGTLIALAGRTLPLKWTAS